MGWCVARGHERARTRSRVFVCSLRAASERVRLGYKGVGAAARGRGEGGTILGTTTVVGAHLSYEGLGLHSSSA